MIQPETIGPNDDACAVCGGCLACLGAWPLLGALASTIALG